MLQPSASGGMEIVEHALQQADNTRTVVQRSGALADVADIFLQQFHEQSAIIVADDNTYRVAGKAAEKILRDAGITVRAPQIFPGNPQVYADNATVEALGDVLEKARAIPIAVGSGSLNDIVKNAAHDHNIDYMVIGTAASMDGYTAMGASITIDGLKTTVLATAPRAVVADVDVMAQAPGDLTASGYGDLAAKIPTGADWILADELGLDPIMPEIWSMVQGPLRESLSNPQALAEGNPQAIGKLSEGMIMSGLSMQASHSSRPVSSAEHMFSHIWEMEGLGLELRPRRLSHGFKVAVGTISMLSLYEWILDFDLTEIDPDQAAARWPSLEARLDQVAAMFPNPLMRKLAIANARETWVNASVVASRVATITSSWAQLAPRLRAQIIPARELANRFETVGAPSSPAQIGLTAGELNGTYRRARYIRTRYSLLDLVEELGIMNDALDALFHSGFWGQR